MKCAHGPAAAALCVSMLGGAHAQTKVITPGTQGGPMPSATRAQPAGVLVVRDCHFGNDGAGASGLDHSYSLRFQTPDKVIVFGGDTGHREPVLALARGADLLVHEVIDLDLIEKAMSAQLPPAVAEGLMRHMREEHTTAEDVGRLTKAAAVKALVLNHVIPGKDEPDSVYLDPVRKHYDGPATVARDLQSF